MQIVRHGCFLQLVEMELASALKVVLDQRDVVACLPESAKLNAHSFIKFGPRLLSTQFVPIYAVRPCAITDKLRPVGN